MLLMNVFILLMNVFILVGGNKGRKYTSKKKHKICYAALTARVYHIWKARNIAFWNSIVPRPHTVIQCIKK